MYIKGLAYINFAIKNSKTSDNEALLNNVAIDTLTTIFGPFFKKISESSQELSAQIEKQIEVLVVSSEIGDIGPIGKIVNKIVKSHKLFNLHAAGRKSDQYYEEEGSHKGPVQMEFYIAVADTVNEMLKEESIDRSSFELVEKKIKSYFRPSSSDKYAEMKKKVVKLAKEILGKSYTERALTEVFTVLTKEFLEGNLERLLKEDMDGNYQFEWDITINVYKPTTIVIDEIKLATSNFFFIINDENSRLVRMTYEQIKEAYPEFNFKRAWIAVRDQDNKFGMMSGKNTINDLPNGLKGDITDTFGDTEGVYLSDHDGKLLLGPLFLDSLEFSYAFGYKDDNELGNLLTNSIIKIESKDEDFSGFSASQDIDSYFHFKYLRSMSWKTGSRISSILQAVESSIIPTGAQKSFFDIERAAIRLASRSPPSMKTEISENILADATSLTSFIYSVLYGMEKGLRSSALSSFTHRLIPASPRLLSLHNADINEDYIVELLEAIEPRPGEKDSNYNNFPAEWLEMVTLFSFLDEETQIKDHGLNSFKLRKNQLELIKNVLRRGSGDSSYKFFEMFKDLLSDTVKFEGVDDPIVDEAQGIDDTKLIERVAHAWSDAFGYSASSLLKLAILTFQKQDGNYKIIHATHNYHDWYRLTNRFNLRSLGKGDYSIVPNIELYQNREQYALKHIFSILLSGNQEIVSTVDTAGHLNSDIYHLKTDVPQNSPFLKGLFSSFNTIYSKSSHHYQLLDQFLNKFWVPFNSPEMQSKTFFEGRSLIKQRIEMMVRDLVTPGRIALEFATEIASLSMATGLHRLEVIRIKREQVVRLITNTYTEFLLNPAQQPHAGKVSVGDFASHMRNLLQDPRINSIPIHFPYSYVHPFWSNFRLIFSLDYFSQRELSIVLPTLSYTYTGTFSSEINGRGNNPSVENQELITSLFSSDILFANMKNRITHTYDLLYSYFAEYLEMSGKDKFTVRYYKELYNGFEQHANLGDNQRHGYINDKYTSNPQTQEELEGTSQTFTIRRNGIIDQVELSRMISNIIYYTNHYDSIAEILEGSQGDTALIVNAYSFLKTTYFISTYGSRSKATHVFSTAAIELYKKSYNSLLSYSVFYNGLSNSGLLPSYLLKGGNNLMLRPLMNNYLLQVSGISNGQDLIQNLGYSS